MDGLTCKTTCHIRCKLINISTNNSNLAILSRIPRLLLLLLLLSITRSSILAISLPPSEPDARSTSDKSSSAVILLLFFSKTLGPTHFIDWIMSENVSLGWHNMARIAFHCSDRSGGGGVEGYDIRWEVDFITTMICGTFLCLLCLNLPPSLPSYLLQTSSSAAALPQQMLGKLTNRV